MRRPGAKIRDILLRGLKGGQAIVDLLLEPVIAAAEPELELIR